MKKKFQLNIVDVMTILIVITFGVLVVGIVRQPERNLGDVATLEVQITSPSPALKEELEKKGTVYLNGVDVPAHITDTKISGDVLYVSVEGRGEKSEERYIFNGQRVLVNQKVEMHGSFWTQGTITGFEIK